MMGLTPLSYVEELQAKWAPLMGSPLDDGYASSSQDMLYYPLWERVPHKLVSQEDFWPAWDPCGTRPAIGDLVTADFLMLS